MSGWGSGSGRGSALGEVWSATGLLSGVEASESARTWYALVLGLLVEAVGSQELVRRLGRRTPVYVPELVPELRSEGAGAALKRVSGLAVQQLGTVHS